jgi:uncharacterized protein
MIINLKTLPKGHSDVAQHVVLSDEQRQQGGLKEPVACSAAIDVLQWQIHLSITYACSVELECSRCCRIFSMPLRGTFRVILQDANSPHAECGEEDVDFYFSWEDAEVDTRGALYDEIITAMPLMPLCSPSCKGIQAPHAQQSTAATTGLQEECDPRWEALKKLKQRKS